MQLKVDGCSDCPLCNISLKLDFYCAHPKFDEKVLLIESDNYENPITPKECPLSEQPIIIYKKRWQTFENFWNKEN
jgi:hypothetical protein